MWVRQTLLSEDTSCGIPSRSPLGRPRFPASVTQLASSQLSINKRHRRSSDLPVTNPFRCRVGLHWVTGGGERDRTDDLLLAKQALSQLSYTPVPEDRDRGSELPVTSASDQATTTDAIGAD